MSELKFVKDAHCDYSVYYRAFNQADQHIGYIALLDDGFYYFWPTNYFLSLLSFPGATEFSSGLSEEFIRALADKLKELNDIWRKEIQKELNAFS